MHYTQCCALALGSHYPEVLHRPTHRAISGERVGFVLLTFSVYHSLAFEAQSAAGNVRAVGFPSPCASAKISRACAQRLAIKRMRLNTCLFVAGCRRHLLAPT